MAAASAEAPPRTAKETVTWASLPGGMLDGGEIVILATKPSVWRPLGEALPWLVFAALFAALIVWFQAPLPGLTIAVSAQLILLVGFARLGLAVALWIPCWHVLTNRRVIDVHGVREPIIRSCSLLHIRNTHVTRTIVHRLLQIGTIKFVINDPLEPPHFWRSIPCPEEVHAAIRRAIEHAIDQFGM
jgi:hypothetical protein